MAVRFNIEKYQEAKLAYIEMLTGKSEKDRYIQILFRAGRGCTKNNPSIPQCTKTNCQK